MKKIIFGCLLLGSCMAGSGDFQSNGLLLRLLGILESVGVGSVATSNFETLTLSGYLKDENGNPIANATMNIVQSTSGSRKDTVTTSVKTDIDGRYTLTLKVGTFTVQVTSSGGASLGSFSVVATSATSNPTLELISGSFIVTISAFNNEVSLAPTSLSYSGTPYTFTKDNLITNKTPTFTGTVTSCRSVPSLPAGLRLSSTCVLSGTPTTAQLATSYNIIATNSYGSTSTVISIIVNQLPPSGLSYSGAPFVFTQNIPISTKAIIVTGTVTSCNISPNLSTDTGLSFNTTDCTISGTPTLIKTATNYTVTASNSVGSSVPLVVSIAVIHVPPSSLSYSGSPFTLLQGLAINSQTPSVTGTITSCTASPTLPSGLSINNTTCVISGTPTALSSASNYTITAGNSGGSTTSTISISVLSPNNYIVSMPTGLLKTGQTTSYLTGDNGTYQKGGARTFTVGGTSGLIWQRCSAGQNNDATCSGRAPGYNWQNANGYCNSLKIGGRSWRLPTINELNNLVDHSISVAPLLDINSFPNTAFDCCGGHFWSSSINPTGLPYYIRTGAGDINQGNSVDSISVKCVTE